jgi:hypothetical protein
LPAIERFGNTELASHGGCRLVPPIADGNDFDVLDVAQARNVARPGICTSAYKTNSNRFFGHGF